MQDDELKFVRKISQLKEFIKILYDEAEIHQQKMNWKKKRMILEKNRSLENYISNDMKWSLPWVSGEDGPGPSKDEDDAAEPKANNN